MAHSFSSRKSERGVSVLMVALSMVALIAMAALSIDVAALYAARSEAQRAADAAALAGAKMFVSSGYTSNPTAWVSTFSSLCQNTGAGGTAAVNRQAELTANANLVAGQAPEVTAITCILGNPQNPQNPRVTVALRRTNVPTFFVRAVGALLGSAVSASTVTASATAEAYNISGQATPIPIQITGVKPWLIPNCNPHGGPCPDPNGYFVDPNDGHVLSNSNVFIGTELVLSRTFNGPAGPGPSVGENGDNIAENTPVMNFYGLRYPSSPAPICPSTSAVSCNDALGASGSNYIDNIACSSTLPFRCGEPVGALQNIQVETGSFSVFTPTRVGTKCLIHASDDGPGQGQDQFSVSDPSTITGGLNNPATPNIENISRSDSIVTVPIYDGTPLCNPGCTFSSKVTGFLQLAVRSTTHTIGPQVDAVILNAVGCTQTLVNAWPPTNPIDLGSASPILVRLVRNP